MSEPRIALIVTGAGARGIFQAGMLKAIHEFKLPIAGLYGTSVGGLNAVLYHQGDMEAMWKTWREIKSSKVFSITPWQSVTEAACVCDSQPLFKLIQSLLKIDKIRSNPIPVTVNTVSLTNWGPFSLKISDLLDEEIAPFLLASSSPPPFFAPVKFRNHLLVDGGLCNNFSIRNALKDQMDVLVIVRATKIKPIHPRNAVQMLGVVTSLPAEAFLERELAFIELMNQSRDERFRPIKVLLIQIPDDHGIGLLDFDYKIPADDLMYYGYMITKKYLTSEPDSTWTLLPQKNVC